MSKNTGHEIITIRNKGKNKTIINISGIIGLPETEQFEENEKEFSTYSSLKRELDKISSIRSHEIIVNIRSAGGNLQDAILIYDCLKEHNARITTRCYGYVASAATIIAQAADHGSREISANAFYLIHQSSCYAEGNYGQLVNSSELLAATDQRLAGIYAENSGKCNATYSELMAENGGQGIWLTPEEVLEYGLADKIIESKKITPSQAKNIMNLGYPALPEIVSNGKLPFWKRLKKRVMHNTSNKKEAVTNKIKLQTNEMESVNMPVNEQVTIFPTTTKAKEDPSHHEMSYKHNMRQYEEDIKNIKG